MVSSLPNQSSLYEFVTNIMCRPLIPSPHPTTYTHTHAHARTHQSMYRCVWAWQVQRLCLMNDSSVIELNQAFQNPWTINITAISFFCFRQSDGRIQLCLAEWKKMIYRRRIRMISIIIIIIIMISIIVVLVLLLVVVVSFLLLLTEQPVLRPSRPRRFGVRYSLTPTAGSVKWPSTSSRCREGRSGAGWKPLMHYKKKKRPSEALCFSLSLTGVWGVAASFALSLSLCLTINDQLTKCKL